MKIKRLLHLGSAFVLSLSTLLTLGMPLANAADQDCTWTGNADFNFSTAGNWTGCGGGTPGNADRLIFPREVANRGPVNDLDGITFESISFTGSGVSGSPGDYYVSGNPFSLTGGITDNSVPNTSTSIATSWIDADITLDGDQTVNVNNPHADTFLGGNIDGTGSITKTGDGAIELGGDNSAWQGGITASGGDVIASASKSLGDSGDTGAVINSGAELLLYPCGFTTLEGNVTLSGESTMAVGDFAVPKLGDFSSCSGSHFATEIYGASGDPSSGTTLSGTITLGSDITFAGYSGTTTISGPLVGSHSFSMLPGYMGKLVIASSANGSSTPNGTYTSAKFTKTISDSTSDSVDIYGNNVITIDGTRGDTYVAEGGILKGSGTVGSLNIDTGGILAPGHSPGCLTTSGLTLNGTFQAEIGGTTACTGYDQTIVNGSVDVTNGTITPTLYGGFVPSVGQSYTVINNDGSDAVTGTFNGVAQGGTETGDGVTYTVSYTGGDGNDVVLTVQSINAAALPKSPNTGFELLTKNPFAVLATTTLAALSLVVLAKRMNTVRAK